MPKAALLMGSQNDFDALKGCISTCKDFGVELCVRVISAHRTPEVAADFAKSARETGYEVILCAAGKAAHLAGVIASFTTLPVIGIPINASLDGLDALLSMAQMPPGIPVATVAVDGAVNAALLAVQIMAGKHPELVDKLEEHRRTMARSIAAADKAIQEKLP